TFAPSRADHVTAPEAGSSACRVPSSLPQRTWRPARAGEENTAPVLRVHTVLPFASTATTAPPPLGSTVPTTTPPATGSGEDLTRPPSRARYLSPPVATSMPSRSPSSVPT